MHPKLQTWIKEGTQNFLASFKRSLRSVRDLILEFYILSVCLKVRKTQSEEISEKDQVLILSAIRAIKFNLFMNETRSCFV